MDKCPDRGSETRSRNQRIGSRQNQIGVGRSGSKVGSVSQKDRTLHNWTSRSKPDRSWPTPTRVGRIRSQSAASGSGYRNNNLVDDCLKIIFKKLQNREDQNAFGLTCKAWFLIRNFTRESLFFGQGLNSKNSKELSMYLPKIMARYSSLTSVCLENCAELTDSTLSKSKFSGANLKSLSLKGCKKVSDECLAKLFADCPNLVILNLDSCNVTDYVLKILANSCHALQDLTISHCVNISDRGIITLFKGCPNISALKISYCHKITGTGFKNCPNSLTRLYANYCWLSSEGISEIFGAQGLEYLSLSNAMARFPENITVNSKRLKYLNLSNRHYFYSVTSVSITAIVRACPLLEELHLVRCSTITLDGWSQIGVNCKNLRVLNANDCWLLPIEVLQALLAGCERLERLCIRNWHTINDNHVQLFRVMRPDVSVIGPGPE